MKLIRHAHHELWWVAEQWSGRLWHRVLPAEEAMTAPAMLVFRGRKETPNGFPALQGPSPGSR